MAARLASAVKEGGARVLPARAADSWSDFEINISLPPLEPLDDAADRAAKLVRASLAYFFALRRDGVGERAPPAFQDVVEWKNARAQREATLGDELLKAAGARLLKAIAERADVNRTRIALNEGRARAIKERPASADRARQLRAAEARIRANEDQMRINEEQTKVLEEWMKPSAEARSERLKPDLEAIAREHAAKKRRRFKEWFARGFEERERARESKRANVARAESGT